ncbi:unnamed protein product [Bursaphelenchus xylophilus]|uniref:(pine wood nematode) hypothetical protein n=1 Tax=Bursaphelenchus xylophilus TaxID=6326 RepID=A0A1I7S8E1_BURXY|nr:unnamed protein product [Bursaphelenchus xylophilus]CAG9121004.1 unnamed protein product [Bursaphelenchus xylophilus]
MPSNQQDSTSVDHCEQRMASLRTATGLSSHQPDNTPYFVAGSKMYLHLQNIAWTHTTPNASWRGVTLDKFWARWRKEYLADRGNYQEKQTLIPRPEPEKPRGEWKMARIKRAIKSNDGITRNCEIILNVCRLEAMTVRQQTLLNGVPEGREEKNPPEVLSEEECKKMIAERKRKHGELVKGRSIYRTHNKVSIDPPNRIMTFLKWRKGGYQEKLPPGRNKSIRPLRKPISSFTPTSLIHFFSVPSIISECSARA